MAHRISSLLLLLMCEARHSINTQRDRPQFDPHLPSSVTVQQGDTAYLPCRIFNADNM